MPIRILIVDDQPEKIRRIREAMTIAGVGDESVDVAMHAQDARRFVAASVYDIMILDLALPSRAGDVPTSDGGVKLLTEINLRDQFHRPVHIVGLTAHENLKRELSADFERSLWTILQYDVTSDGWLKSILNLIDYVIASNLETRAIKYGTDIVIVTALPHNELRAVRDLPWNWQDARPIDDATLIYEGSFSVNGRCRSVVAASAPRMGMVASALLALKLAHEFRPRILAMIGICAGVRGRVSLGDVILANPAWDWQSGKRTAGPSGVKFEPDPDQLDVDPIIVSRFQRIIDDERFWNDLLSTWRGPKPRTPLLGHIGPIASGSVVLADDDATKAVQGQQRKLLGIEMEIYGVYAAARYSGTPTPVSFALKSVCDFADETKSDDYQDFACRNSAQALKKLAELLFAEPRFSE